MKFVATTSCPTGIAHTCLAAESLEQGAARSGHDIRRDAGRFWLRATRPRGRRAMAWVPNPSHCARKSFFSKIFQPQEEVDIS
ncbi:hypothetical protein [Rhodococcus opacus]|uniref:hypothetical protein n=1 Tax=Rhodococcus opacus TaxID=37919 RepID=UPI0032AF43DA